MLGPAPAQARHSRRNPVPALRRARPTTETPRLPIRPDHRYLQVVPMKTRAEEPERQAGLPM